MKKLQIMISSMISTALIATSCLPALAYTKDETVYTKLNADGSEKMTIVSEHIKNDDEAKTLEDLTTLSNIMNVNGDETFTLDGDKITWNSEGNDIYYQGKTDKQLPISMKITYEFNGEESTVEKMLGQEGTVKIHIQYMNNEKRVYQGEELYVPFVAMTGMMLPTHNNRNVQVTNGKVVSNGSNYIIIAIAAPGLSEDFENMEALDGFDEMTITYQTKSFELKSMMTVVTPSLLSEEDMSIFDKMDEGYSLVDQLVASYGQLEEGGKKLQSGINEFSSQYEGFDKGIDDLYKGIEDAYTGSQSLTSGLTDLNSALNVLDSKSAALNNGAKQTFNALLSTANSQLSLQLNDAGISMNALTIDNYQNELNDVLAKIANATTVQVTNAIKHQVTTEVRQQADIVVQQKVENVIHDKVKQDLVQNIISGHLVAQGIPQMSEEQSIAFLENNENGKTLLENQYQVTLQSMKDNGQFDKYVSVAKNDGTYQTTIATQVQTIMNSEDIQSQIKTLVEKNTSGSQTTAYMQVYNLLVQLETYQQFYDGIQQYTNAVSQIKDGSKNALEGSIQLTSGLNQLKNGASTLLGASAKIFNATNEIKTGINQLAFGLTEFNEKGISQIEKLVKHDLKQNVDKVEKLEKLANEYKTFTNIYDNVEGTTKFIMIVDSKKK